ncbi:unnamed protein product [Caretta caretta]
MRSGGGMRKRGHEEKKMGFKLWQVTHQEQDFQEYKKAKMIVKEIAAAKVKAKEGLYAHLQTKEGEKKIHRLAKTCNKNIKDIGEIPVITDESGNILIHENQIKEWWRNYFEKLVNEKNPRELFHLIKPNQGLVAPVLEEAVAESLNDMKSKKALGLNGIPVEIWKCPRQVGVNIDTTV